MPFHPDQNLPDCMMPDGGECCSGHAAVCEDWHKQRATITQLIAEIETQHDSMLCAVRAVEAERDDLQATVSRLTEARDIWKADDERLRKVLVDISDMVTDARLVDRLREIGKVADAALATPPDTDAEQGGQG
jgi:hypothetical protein